MDADSALIWSPSHFTWMDTNHPAGTPREGYPVEIQVLWIRLLRQLENISRGDAKKNGAALAERAPLPLKNFFGSKNVAITPICCWPNPGRRRAANPRRRATQQRFVRRQPRPGDRRTRKTLR
jgi:starch synthase (maltosyl-transferring)